MSVCFLSSWGMNRSAGQTSRMNREAIVCSALLFVPNDPPPHKKTLIPSICNASKQTRESTEGYSKSIVRKNNDKFGKRIGLNK